MKRTENPKLSGDSSFPVGFAEGSLAGLAFNVHYRCLGSICEPPVFADPHIIPLGADLSMHDACIGLDVTISKP